MALQHLRSSTANKRPTPAAMSDGQLAMNTNLASPGLFLKDSNGDLVKVGPVHVGTTAPNATPASGGQAGNSVGEQWLDTSSSRYVFKIWDGTAWRTEDGEFVNSSGDTMTGALVMDNQQQVRFRETTANGTNFVALQAPASVASDKTITLPDVTGTVVTTGDTGSVTSTMILDGTILNADVNASAAIAGTKIAPDFGSQTIATTGVFSHALGAAATPSVTFTGDPNTGIYSPGADQLAISTNGTGRLFVDASGNITAKLATAETNYVYTSIARTPSFQITTATTEGVAIKGSDGAGGLALVNGATSTLADRGYGTLYFMGYDGTNYRNGAAIIGSADATTGTGDMPGRLVFATSADGAASPIERMRITSAGLVGIGTNAPGDYYADADNFVIYENGNSGITIASATTGNGSLLFADGTTGTSEYAGFIVYAHSDNSLQFGANAGEAFRVDSSKRILVGTSSTSSTAGLIVQGAGGAAPGIIRACYTTATPADGDIFGYLVFGDSAHADAAWVAAARDGGTWSGSSKPTRLVFSTTADGASSPTERMRIQSNGAITFGASTNTSPAQNNATNICIDGANNYAAFSRANAEPVGINRASSDGTLVLFYQDGTQEGTISVSGTTVSYNGAHLSRWSQLPSGAERKEILRGSVLSNIDEMCEWDEEDNEQLNRMKVSTVEGDKNVSGVFQCWDDDDDTYTDDFYCAMTGDFIIRIAEGVTVQRGDLLMSAGDGTAKPQDDDIIRSKTIAKVTSTHVTCTYDDGSYCVPCVLMAC
jgi:hypothetical protein